MANENDRIEIPGLFGNRPGTETEKRLRNRPQEEHSKNDRLPKDVLKPNNCINNLSVAETNLAAAEAGVHTTRTGVENHECKIKELESKFEHAKGQLNRSVRQELRTGNISSDQAVKLLKIGDFSDTIAFVLLLEKAHEGISSEKEARNIHSILAGCKNLPQLSWYFQRSFETLQKHE